MLQVTSVSSAYGRVQVLRDVSLQVEEGEVVAVIGSNGAGKTTLLRTISGLLPTRAGSVFFQGKEIGRMASHQIVRLGMAHVPERRLVFAPFSVMTNLELGAAPRRRSMTRQALESQFRFAFDLFPVLERNAQQKAGTLSGGEQQMLAIARALVSSPSFLLMDEPSIGLAPKVIEAIYEAIRALRSRGVTILLVEQNATLALETADRAYVMEQGRIVLEGTARSLLASHDVQRLYMGVEN